MYISNVYWDSAAAPQDLVDFSVTATDAEAQASELNQSGSIPPERRWDAERLELVTAEGPEASVARIQLDDREWGYAGGRFDAMRLTGLGGSRLLLATNAASPPYRYVYARFRSVGSPVEEVSLAWQAVGEDMVQLKRALPLRTRSTGEWTVAQLPLWNVPAWKNTSAVETLAIVFKSSGPMTIDVDFIILAP